MGDGTPTLLREKKNPVDERPQTLPAQTTPQAQPQPAPKPARKRKWLRWTLLLVGPLLLIGLALYFYLTGGRYVSTDNAYVRADKVMIATDVSGIVAEVAVRDNQKVQADQLLFRLDDEPFRITVEQAKAQLGAVRNELIALQATYRQKLQDVKQAQTDVTFFQRQYDRQQELFKRRVTAQASLDQARRDLQGAQQKLASSQQEAASVLASLGGNADQPVEQNARYKAAQAQLEQAERDLRQTTVKAPMAGIVTNVDQLQPGEYLASAQAAFALVGTDHLWVEANPKETDLTYVRPGDPATVTVDTYPGREWQGRVQSVSPASGAEFSLLPAQNASGNWVKVVQRIPMRIRLDLPPAAPPLRSGMSVEVEVDTGHHRTLAGLFHKIGGWVGL